MREHQMPSFYLFYYTETLIMAQTSLTCHFWCTEPQWKLMTEVEGWVHYSLAQHWVVLRAKQALK